MKDIKITNLIKFYILLFLYKEPMHGYELIKKLELITNQKISASHVYPFLDKLEKNKVIELKTKSARDKKEYILSKEGKKFTKEIIDRFSNLITINTNLKIKSCVHCDCKLIEGMYKEKINNKLEYFCCKYCADSFKKFKL